MLIDCHYCEARVDAKILAQQTSSFPDDPFPFRVTFLQCPVCGRAVLAGEEQIQVGEEKYEWTHPARLWPQPKRHLDWNIPEIVRDSLEEAQLCYDAKAFSACAVMCGRALEGMLRHYKTKSKTLAGGLKQLLEMKVIDARLYNWGEELRRLRNLGAHASTEKISKEDAKDILDFTKAICDYVFVLTARFDRFMRRKDAESAA